MVISTVAGPVFDDELECESGIRPRRQFAELGRWDSREVLNRQRKDILMWRKFRFSHCLR